ncbi:MAG: hypothetical protein JWQ81_945 [Amycolatopsis sp.]|uniref:MarR family transcriptional regulator n=1 Tax=Amycolatopsis sp. TaxID=37632 RepID=UPI002615E846|nr:helix-turn-helix domain-containing protein [Amycolatopsis sp.]MCU1680206.1 hypothetical protein [Amycolatopsis sp.]
MSSKTRTRKTSTTATTRSATALRSVPDQKTAATTRTDTEDKLWEALHTNPNSSAADLSVAAKIGKSTAQKILVKWEADGSVTRTAGIVEGGRRAADLWTITDIDAAPAEGEAAESPSTEPTFPTADETDPGDAEPVASDETQAADDGAATAADPASDKPRLVPGALRGMVEDYLRDHPGQEFGPTAIAKELGGKSSGAVSNALDKLVEDGVAAKTNDKPRRFALAPAEAAATTAAN